MSSTLSPRTGDRGTIDDGTLRELAREPERSVFPLLSQAEAMIPLVVVLAFLPALYAVDNRTLSEAGAWEGLVSLRCLAADNLAEFVDPSAVDASHPLRFQPPLMSWLTAIGMRIFGTGNASGLVAAAYLCTAGLVVSGYVLARRMGAEQLGLVTAMLLAFNPQILKGAQEPLPQSVASLLAVLALAGAVAHWQRSSAVTSYQLLLAGIVLGVCLLAGGPVALAVVLIILLYVLWWKGDAWLRRGSRIAFDRSQFNRRTAIRSTAVLAATAFAVGGWDALLMSSRYGSEFWSGWLRAGASGTAEAPQLAGQSWLLESVLDLNRLVLPLLPLTIVGIFGIVRALSRPDEDPAKHHRGLLLVWTAVALLTWILVGGVVDSSAPGIKVWETFLTLPLVILAALGLMDMAERRIGFIPSLVIGLVTLADAGLSMEWWWFRPAADSLPESWGGWGSVSRLALMALLAVVGIAVARLSRGQEARRRIVLTGALLAIVTVNCLWGLLAARQSNSGDRELEEMRAGLARLPRVDRYTFVALAPADVSQKTQPPAQLVYTLGSLWPDAVMNYAASWEDAASQNIPVVSSSEKTAIAYVAWSPRGRVRSAAPGGDLRSVAPAYLYRGLEVVAYVRDQALPVVPGGNGDVRSTVE